MKAGSAIQKFFNAKVKEIKEFKKVCTDSEWKRFGKQACEILGEKYER